MDTSSEIIEIKNDTTRLGFQSEHVDFVSLAKYHCFFKENLNLSQHA